MLYAVLRWVASIALRWFYRDIEVRGLERVPRGAPTILVGNHPNALIDAMTIGVVVPHQVLLTAKGTFFDHPLLGRFFRALGIVPLRRARDEADAVRRARADGAPRPDPHRNAGAFGAILDALADGRTVLIFPEGTTHSKPELEPLRTGAARLALQARDDRGIRGVRIVPVGLVFEEKSRPRSRILVQVGDPIAIDEWPARAATVPAVDALTAEVDARLRAVTLNFPTADAEHDARLIARLLADAEEEPRPIREIRAPLAREVALVHRVEAARRALDGWMPGVESTDGAPPDDAPVRARAVAFLRRLDVFDGELAARRVAANDVAISLSPWLGARFALREGAIVALGGPLALWGRVNHWLPFRIARAMGRRPTLDPEEPAMHTVAWGLAAVLVAYAFQTVLVWRLTNGWWALAYLLSLPPSATWDLRFQDRTARAAQRVRAYLWFRRHPVEKARLSAELAWLRAEAEALEESIG